MNEEQTKEQRELELAQEMSEQRQTISEALSEQRELRSEKSDVGRKALADSDEYQQAKERVYKLRKKLSEAKRERRDVERRIKAEATQQHSQRLQELADEEEDAEEKLRELSIRYLREVHGEDHGCEVVGAPFGRYRAECPTCGKASSQDRGGEFKAQEDVLRHPISQARMKDTVAQRVVCTKEECRDEDGKPKLLGIVVGTTSYNDAVRAIEDEHAPPPRRVDDSSKYGSVKYDELQEHSWRVRTYDMTATDLLEHGWDEEDVLDAIRQVRNDAE